MNTTGHDDELDEQLVERGVPMLVLAMGERRRGREAHHEEERVHVVMLRSRSHFVARAHFFFFASVCVCDEETRTVVSVSSVLSTCTRSEYERRMV